MPTEVKNKSEMLTIADQAQQSGLVPGQVIGVLDELGVEHDGSAFTADADALDLVREALADLKGSKEVPLRAGATPRDVANALGRPQNEIQKTLVAKFKVMATLTTALKDEVAEMLAREFGYEVRWAEASQTKAGGFESGFWA